MVVPIGSAKSGLFGGFDHHATSCGVAGVALCDIATCFITCQKLIFCDRRDDFVSLSDEFHSSQQAWQVQHGAALERHPYLVCLAGVTLQTCRVQQFRRFVLHAFANCISAASRS